VLLGVGHIPRALAAFLLLLPPSIPVVRGVGNIGPLPSKTCDGKLWLHLSVLSPFLSKNVLLDSPHPVSLALGESQYEHPVPDMRGTNGGSWYAMPLRIIPERGQRPENSVQPSSKQPCHVLQHNRSGS
jgi:hypothetical protein